MNAATSSRSISAPIRKEIPQPRVDLFGVFDRVVVINLARRRERLERFRSRLQDWPFKPPQRFEAVDGSAILVPAGWDKGPGAWGCMLSHRAVVESAIRDRVGSLLVLEDDATPVPHFALLAEEFLTNVPADWDGLMFGAEHLLPPALVCRGVVRCGGANRAHAYAVRGQMMLWYLEFMLRATSDHCDIVLASLMQHFKVYAPNPLLIAQGAGFSDITKTQEPVRFVSSAHAAAIG